ncbi:signal peptide peptidase SppA [Lichenihabitans sp. Uapishka_5]|uniref:signal peptide peptidase SppA n=1 Tax=Lichenihabitans sp. Uapishka_5 TaxID=3037302 RepID=UPI0029E810CA|nr:signal peptide peptidase SppA [Lichenihabitans sp. Uapishka_5]MDX7950718.1 signal peptide peptidase SppA [Lichenihabitans sp. Uapishka_5]
MSMATGSADYLLDRRRLRRKLLFWRTAGFALLALIVLGLALRATASRSAATLVPHIARIQISGLITGDDKTLDLIRDVGASAATGVIVVIDSPGGTTVGSERVYDALRAVAAKKPTVAEIHTLGASGAYIAALGADHIVAYGNSLVGSIGVLFEFPNFAKLLDTVGVSVEKIKSSPLKAEPDGFTPTSDAARAAIDALVVDSYGWFKGLVQDRRHMSDAELAAVDDGRVFTGRQSVPLKLIDQLGTEKDSIAWLEGKGVAKDLPVRDWKRRSDRAFGLFGAASSAAETLGAPGLAHVLGLAASLETVRPMDGLQAIWIASPRE